MRLRNEKPTKENVQSEVGEVSRGNLVEAFGITMDQMMRAAEILTKDESTEKLGHMSAWLTKGYEPGSYNKDADNGEKEVLFIQMGSTKGMTFKIKVNDSVFSSLFDTGAQVSCIKYNTMDALGLLHHISENNLCIRTANGQDIGVKASVMINSKIRRCSFTHKFVVCEGLTRPFMLGKEFLSCHCFKLGWTNSNKRFAEYTSEIIAGVSQTVMGYIIIVSCPLRIPARNFAMVPTKCPNMFSGRVEACPCHKFRNKFQNLYLEPM